MNKNLFMQSLRGVERRSNPVESSGLLRSARNDFIRLCLALLCTFSLSVWINGCSSSAGGGTPSTEIPAPVSHLSISSPDSNGLVRVTGEAGFADGGSTVTLTNSSTTSFHFPIDLLVRNAFAQATASVTANADGSFVASLSAAAGDNIAVSYTKDGAVTEAETAVPENQPPLPSATDGVVYQDVTYNPTTEEAIVVANDGANGFLVFFNITTEASTTVTLDGLSGANRVALDDANQIVVIADGDDPDTIFHYHIGTGNLLEDATGGNQVVDVSASPSGNYAVLAFDNSNPAFSYYDVINDLLPVDGTAINDNQSSQSRAHGVDVSTAGESDLAALVSEAGDGSFFLTTHLVDTALPLFTQLTSTTLTGLGSPGSLDFFGPATEALITDRTNDLVLRVTIATEEITTIAAGDDPRGVAVERGNEKAFVVNSGDRTLSSINLTTNEVTSAEDLGLAPTAVAVDPTGEVDTVIVLNSGDNTLTLFDPE